MAKPKIGQKSPELDSGIRHYTQVTDIYKGDDPKKQKRNNLPDDDKNNSDFKLRRRRKQEEEEELSRIPINTLLGAAGASLLQGKDPAEEQNLTGQKQKSQTSPRRFNIKTSQEVSHHATSLAPVDSPALSPVASTPQSAIPISNRTAAMIGGEGIVGGYAAYSGFNALKSRLNNSFEPEKSAEGIKSALQESVKQIQAETKISAETSGKKLGQVSKANPYALRTGLAKFENAAIAKASAAPTLEECVKIISIESRSALKSIRQESMAFANATEPFLESIEKRTMSFSKETEAVVEIAGKFGSKRLPAMLGRKIPLGLGVLIGAATIASDGIAENIDNKIAKDPTASAEVRAYAAKRATLDKKNEAFDGTSATAGIIPGWGTMASIGVDAGSIGFNVKEQMALDKLPGKEGFEKMANEQRFSLSQFSESNPKPIQPSSQIHRPSHGKIVPKTLPTELSHIRDEQAALIEKIMDDTSLPIPSKTTPTPSKQL